MISNLKYDIEYRRDKAQELSSQVEQHLAAGGRCTRSEPAQINPPPVARSTNIDPRHRPQASPPGHFGGRAQGSAETRGGYMSRRKANNGFARAERSCRALLRTNHVAVMNIDPSGTQIMVNWKSCRQIRSLAIANALFDFAYHWTIYLSAMCRDERAVEYVKSVEISPEGIYKVERLTDAIEHYYLELRGSCNPNHIVASGWIAAPAEVTLDEAQAAKLFYAAGAWHQVKVAA